MFVGRFKDVLRKFQGRFKKESSVFQENFINSFNGVSLNEVSFAILLHESHRSYPSRGRAC